MDFLRREIRRSALAWLLSPALLGACSTPASQSSAAFPSSAAQAPAAKPAAAAVGASPGPGATASSRASAAPATLEGARSLAQRTIIVDGHVDLPFRLHMGGPEQKPWAEDVSVRTAGGDFDYVRARAGGLDAPFMSIYVPSKYQQSGGARALADSLIDGVERLTARYPEKFSIAESPTAVREIVGAGRIALPLGIENGAALEKDLAAVEHFRKRGVSYITLTHATDNAICDSSYSQTYTHGGLSAWGEEVVAEMNRVGVLVDVAHVSDAAFEQAVEASRVPVIASHSSLRHFVPGFERNASDELVRKLAGRGGVIMINFGSAFLIASANARSKERQDLGASYATEKGLDRDEPQHRKSIEEHVDAQLPMIHATVQDVADHIDRVKRLVGIDHVGLGSDFDGVGDSLPSGLKDASEYPNLLLELRRRGYSDEELEKLCSGNLLRVWQAALDYAEDRAKR